MIQKSYVINNFNKFAEDIRQAVAHAILKNSFPDQKNEVLDDLDSFITIYQVKEIIKNNALAVADDPVVDLKGMDNAWTQVNQGIFSAALSKLAASGDIECAWDDKANNMIFWPKEKAKVDQTSKVLKAGKTSTNSLVMEFISIPAGSFTMGSPETEKGHSDNEKQVPVTITQAFELGKTVVTQKQWAEVMGTDPWNWENLKEIGNNYSAVYVSWLDATKFCKKLTALEHKSGKLSANQTYRLPTEAEWEYACRAGTTTAFSCGDDESSLGDYAWFGKNSKGNLHEVATKKPSPWGLFDMHGNVYEWCKDYYEDSLSGGKDPKGPSTGPGRVIRGGYWRTYASNCRSADRNYCNPASRFFNVGFRFVRVLV